MPTLRKRSSSSKSLQGLLRNDLRVQQYLDVRVALLGQKRLILLLIRHFGQHNRATERITPDRARRAAIIRCPVSQRLASTDINAKRRVARLDGLAHRIIRSLTGLVPNVQQRDQFH
ncbi:hypothetical protein [Bradyrhizobium sp. STM 3557]|uniref:hypothetical protein n=1 Tax=Bradyrhizobium sp. STM 3557 TaxID=578920 RepID=UPI00388F71EB